MTRFVALFRGINVGKAKRIAMADLRALLTGMGYADVQTLLNSGNVIFASPSGTQAQHATAIRAAATKTLGVDALVIVKSANDMAQVVAANPLDTQTLDSSRYIVALTCDATSLAALGPLTQTDWGHETLHLGAHAAYLWCADGILQSKMAVALLKALANTGTTRNWATIKKIHMLLHTTPAKPPRCC